MADADPFTIVEVAGKFAVAHRPTWQRDLGERWQSLHGARWIADGPFDTLSEAEAARCRLTAVDRSGQC